MVFYLYSDGKGLGAEDCFALRDPNAKKDLAGEEAALDLEAWEPQEKPWKPAAKSWEPWQTKSWQPWWARGGDTAWPTEKKEPWWWKQKQHDPWSYPPAAATSEYQAHFWSPPSECGFEEYVKGGCCTDEVTTKRGSSHSGANSTCSGSDEEETKASRDEDCSEELEFAGSSAPPSPIPELVIPFTRPPPGLELLPPAGPPPGLPPPRGLKMPNQQGPEQRKCTTLSLVDMLPE
jgi:hypothetical protein